MAIIQLKSLSLSWGGPPVLDQVDLVVEPGERLGLVGRNGAGKSSLMKVILDQVEPEGGEVIRSQGLRCAMMPQEVPAELPGRVRERIETAALQDSGRTDWDRKAGVDTLISKLDLDADAETQSLSAGGKRCALLAEALASEPQLLLLDEPTNHLDLRAIETLEEMLGKLDCALLFVTHDRSFLERVATRILDLDRGRLTSWDCDYQTYLQRKDAELEAETQRQAQFDKKLAKEEAWIRRGTKARTRRNMGRVARLKEMRDERRARRDEVGKARGSLQQARSSGMIVTDAEGLSFSRGDLRIVQDLDLRVTRGDRLAIVGPNGCGKTTLINLLLGQLEPDAGEIKLGTKIELAHFDQLHLNLDLSKTPFELVGEGSDHITVGKGSRHVMGYLQDFLFDREQVRSAASKLSGGERNRLQLARILARPANVLVLDEPTNDLDLETLELLEDVLADFSGTLIVVSHDRAFIDNVATSTLVFEGEGRWREYDGGFEDWQRQRKQEAKAEAAAAKSRKSAAQQKPKERPRRLTWKEQRELEELPARLESLEEKKDALFQRMAEPDFYKSESEEIVAAQERLAALEAELETSYARWEELEEFAD